MDKYLLKVLLAGSKKKKKSHHKVLASERLTYMHLVH